MKIDYTYLHAALDKVEHTTTINAFYNQFHAIQSMLSFLHPEIPESYFSLRFAYGLQAEFQEFVLRFNPLTVMAAYHLAAIYEESIYLDYFPEDEIPLDHDNVDEEDKMVMMEDMSLEFPKTMVGNYSGPVEDTAAETIDNQGSAIQGIAMLFSNRVSKPKKAENVLQFTKRDTIQQVINLSDTDFCEASDHNFNWEPGSLICIPSSLSPWKVEIIAANIGVPNIVFSSPVLQCYDKTFALANITVAIFSGDMNVWAAIGSDRNARKAHIYVPSSFPLMLVYYSSEVQKYDWISGNTGEIDVVKPPRIQCGDGIQSANVLYLVETGQYFMSFTHGNNAQELMSVAQGCVEFLADKSHNSKLFVLLLDPSPYGLRSGWNFDPGISHVELCALERKISWEPGCFNLKLQILTKSPLGLMSYKSMSVFVQGDDYMCFATSPGDDLLRSIVEDELIVVTELNRHSSTTLLVSVTLRGVTFIHPADPNTYICEFCLSGGHGKISNLMVIWYFDPGILVIDKLLEAMTITLKLANVMRMVTAVTDIVTDFDKLLLLQVGWQSSRGDNMGPTTALAKPKATHLLLLQRKNMDIRWQQKLYTVATKDMHYPWENFQRVSSVISVFEPVTVREFWLLVTLMESVMSDRIILINLWGDCQRLISYESVQLHSKVCEVWEELGHAHADLAEIEAGKMLQLFGLLHSDLVERLATDCEDIMVVDNMVGQKSLIMNIISKGCIIFQQERRSGIVLPIAVFILLDVNRNGAVSIHNLGDIVENFRILFRDNYSLSTHMDFQEYNIVSVSRFHISTAPSSLLYQILAGTGHVVGYLHYRKLVEIIICLIFFGIELIDPGMGCTVLYGFKVLTVVFSSYILLHGYLKDVGENDSVRSLIQVVSKGEAWSVGRGYFLGSNKALYAQSSCLPVFQGLCMWQQQGCSHICMTHYDLFGQASLPLTMTLFWRYSWGFDLDILCLAAFSASMFWNGFILSNQVEWEIFYGVSGTLVNLIWRIAWMSLIQLWWLYTLGLRQMTTFSSSHKQWQSHIVIPLSKASILIHKYSCSHAQSSVLVYLWYLLARRNFFYSSMP